MGHSEAMFVEEDSVETEVWLLALWEEPKLLVDRMGLVRKVGCQLSTGRRPTPQLHPRKSLG